MIPPVIHFIWVSLGEEMRDLYRLCILSAVLNTSCKVVLHTDDPSIQLPRVETRVRSFPTQINGHLFNPHEEVNHNVGGRVSHLKDVVRLEILYEEGGIYSDLDVLWLRNPFYLLDSEVVIGYQHKGYKTLCNAVLFAQPHHPAIKDYLDWTISIYPPKKYWIPANPYKLWKEKYPSLTYLDPVHFFKRVYSDTRPYSLEKLQKSTAIHLCQSFGGRVSGSLIDSLKRAAYEQLGVSLQNIDST